MVAWPAVVMAGSAIVGAGASIYGMIANKDDAKGADSSMIANRNSMMLTADQLSQGQGLTGAEYNRALLATSGATQQASGQAISAGREFNISSVAAERISQMMLDKTLASQEKALGAITSADIATRRENEKLALQARQSAFGASAAVNQADREAQVYNTKAKEKMIQNIVNIAGMGAEAAMAYYSSLKTADAKKPMKDEFADTKFWTPGDERFSDDSLVDYDGLYGEYDEFVPDFYEDDEE